MLKKVFSIAIAAGMVLSMCTIALAAGDVRVSVTTTGGTFGYTVPNVTMDESIEKYNTLIVHHEHNWHFI